MKSSVSRSSGSTSNAKIQHEVNSSKSSAYPPWGSISTVTTGIFLNTKKTEEGKQKSCQQNKHLSTKNVKNVADEDKYKSLKEAKTDSEVAFDANLKKFVNKIRNESLKQTKTTDSEESCDENTDIMKSIPGLDFVDENGIGVNYEGDEIDEIDNNDNNDNKSSLNDYHLSQYLPHKHQILI